MQRVLPRRLCQRAYWRAQEMDCRFFSLRNFVIHSKLRKQIEKVRVTMPRRRLRRRHLACHNHRLHHRRRPRRHRR